MNVTIDQFLQIIGELAVENRLLRGRIAELEQLLQPQVEHVDDLAPNGRVSHAEVPA